MSNDGLTKDVLYVERFRFSHGEKCSYEYDKQKGLDFQGQDTD